ncbi:TPM domain-containing protein [Chryseobacterium limigenitum]|uniref:TLP18.3, Psb32 and MOLO-1 founding protein of phosphatase n=1 Tax=Chryseobacterium limigenitum TaxID=1612149 RepID=A0A1K2IV21_9FLAO|nr:TPM domain-containing protein [Chryseobacterium limigenitum]SFZ96158.1 TLP18.3, Psb32 and MOLO-1 founding protein of phosphatase [Chryseobacterium limigenitum]
MSNFLTDQQIASLVEAIQSAEEHSTGEIRVHIDSTTEDQNAKTAFEVFKKLCQNKTAERNAVLFHVNFEKKYLTIIGDVGIHDKVYQSFWDHLHDYITSEFAKGNYHKALKSAILETGLELKKHFPVKGENPNQLSNEITFS